MQERLFSHQVLDEFGDRLKLFQSLREAKWFIENKPNCTIQSLNVKRETDYEFALRVCEECPF